MAGGEVARARSLLWSTERSRPPAAGVATASVANLAATVCRGITQAAAIKSAVAIMAVVSLIAAVAGAASIGGSRCRSPCKIRLEGDRSRGSRSPSIATAIRCPKGPSRGWGRCGSDMIISGVNWVGSEASFCASTAVHCDRRRGEGPGVWGMLLLEHLIRTIHADFACFARPMARLCSR